MKGRSNYELRVVDCERRFYDTNIWSPKKRDEKLNYMHNNPVKQGLVKHPGDYPWPSWKFYLWNDGSILGMEKML